jgi:CheY-like chemotaxis protein
MLVGQGYEVRAAAGPLEALDLLDHGLAPELIVSDLVMPKLSGVAFAERVGALLPGTRFLFISGYSGHRVLQDGTLPEGAQLLQKPFTGAELTNAVRHALDDPAERPFAPVDA